MCARPWKLDRLQENSQGFQHPGLKKMFLRGSASSFLLFYGWSTEVKTNFLFESGNVGMDSSIAFLFFFIRAIVKDESMKPWDLGILTSCLFRRPSKTSGSWIRSFSSCWSALMAGVFRTHQQEFTDELRIHDHKIPSSCKNSVQTGIKLFFIIPFHSILFDLMVS